MEPLQRLYHSLKERRRPEDIAALVLEVLQGDLSDHERAIISKAAGGALKRNVFGYTSMSQTFAKVVGAKKQTTKAAEFFQQGIPDGLDADQPRQVESFVGMLSPALHKEVGKNNFLNRPLAKGATQSPRPRPIEAGLQQALAAAQET